MGAGVSHGADTDCLRAVAAGLSGSARVVLEVQQSGTSSMGVLVESWAGPDTEVLAADWQQSVPVLAAAAERLSTLAKLLIEQAEQQDQASEGGGSEAASVPRGRAVPDSGAFPFGRSPLGRPDLRAGLKVPNVNWPGVGALVSPIHSPFVQRPLQYYRDIYQDWQDSGLTWFEAMFVPWPLPDKLRNTYLDLVDDGTDWANDIYKDHVRDLPGIRDARWAAHQANDAVEFADFFIAPLDWAFGPTVPGLAWNIVKDSVNETTEILDDPKGWWDGASGLDQAGVVVSVVPGVGLVGKGVAKGIKHLAARAAPGPVEQSGDPAG